MAQNNKKGNLFDFDLVSIEHNPNKVIKKKFPDSTSNVKEIQAIETELTAFELTRISVGPNQHDFGQIFVKSKNQFSFSVFNGNNKHIKVELLFSTILQLCKSGPVAQVIPPNTMASFELVLLPMEPEVLRIPVV